MTLDQFPLRAEIFSAAQLEQHGRILATKHKVSIKKASDDLLARLDENERVIADSCMLIVHAVEAKMSAVPAAVWLLDNFYLIEEQIRIAKRHLPRDYSRGLPLLEQSGNTGLPRIYEIAMEIISHGDGRIDIESLTSFILAYQETSPLLLGELWALPIMLRLALIENLRRISDRLVSSLLSRNVAEMWANQMIEVAEKSPSALILVVADMARSSLALDGAFIAELTRRLHGHPAAMTLPLNWIEQSLSQSFMTSEQKIQIEIQQQAADQVSVSNSIGTLRLLNTTNWRDFVEAASIVERTLRMDPAGIYRSMDFSTRDNYRHRVEEFSKQSTLSETEIAQAALHLAKSSTEENPRARHIGYYLTQQGTLQLARDISAQPSLKKRLRTWAADRPLLIYLGAISLLACLITGELVRYAVYHGVTDWFLAWTGFLSLMAAVQISISLVNWLTTLWVNPHLIPRMNYAHGIPASARTLVAVPSLLVSIADIDHLCEALEVRYLANRCKNLYFSLLTDFTDALTENQPADNALIKYAGEKIDELNEKYAGSEEDVFFLFHRPRLWNPIEKTWMGYERKRGKLSALNKFLRGGNTAEFSFTAGRVTALQNIKYVITLDADTQLPRDAARQFIGAMAHPLNQPRYDETKQMVTEGYGILQPRVVSSLTGASLSLYARFRSDEPGIDPYTRAVSDVYQDAFHEGSFIGKGIYDIDAFEYALKDRLPENRILSHDLLEGCYARAGLLSDVPLYEEYPPRYSTDAARRRRWIRGDWQIASWILPSVPSTGEQKTKNPLSALSRWKIFDNLRRSFLPPALLLLLLTGWFFLPASWLWTMVVAGVFLISPLFATSFALIRPSKTLSLRKKIDEALPRIYQHFFQTAFELIVLPYEAFYHVEAVIRALWRIYVSHHKLLEWVPSSESSRRGSNTVAASYARMWFSPFLAVITGATLFTFHPTFLATTPVIVAWLLSPLFVWQLGLPLVAKEPALSTDQTWFLNKIARQTWAFFETYVGPDDNWLPPDNIQEKPIAAVAHRTSPTNMGLALLANLTAWDFGYITTGRLVHNTIKTIDTMSTLPRYRGHFYNWYDTQSLKPLHPLYVSFVDSGNLSGHLMTLRQGLLSVINAPVIAASFFEGLRVTVAIMKESGEKVPAGLEEKLAASAPTDLSGFLQRTKELMSLITDSSSWSAAFVAQCQYAIDDLTAILSLDASAIEGIPTVSDLAQSGNSWAIEKARAIEKLVVQAEEMSEVEYSFLHDPSTQLLSIGYNVDAQRRDASYYDLLASEARLGYFVAIAQGKLSQESWFGLGRQLAKMGGEAALVSWSGSMFEYLMPLLVMPTFDSTLIDQTYRAVVRMQIAYGTQRGVPWGISESGYNMFDGHLNYQYRAFGVPGIGLKRGLGDDLVIAPYASVMSLMVAPEEACRNLQIMAAEGFAGRFGLYEAIDYTSSRLQRGKTHAIIQSFMAHHQGMSFLSLSYLLLNRPMQRRFEADPRFAATMQLLHEKAAKLTTVDSVPRQIRASEKDTVTPPPLPVRILTTADTRTPEVQLLSNGRYHVMVSNAGGSYSRWRDLAVTRWREDSTRDNWGTFCYIRDLADGSFWSSSYQPTLKEPKHYEAIFSESRAEFRRRDKGIETHTEIVVSPEDDIEIRRSRITNISRQSRTIDVTSYAEIVLAPHAADAAHPAFSNLFVQTEILNDKNAILCTRRPRSTQETPPWMFHMMSMHDAAAKGASFETDRMKFLGRGRTVMAPQALLDPAPLSGSQGSVLDPIASVRREITLEPGQSVTVDIITGVTTTREGCLSLIHKYQDLPLADRVFEMTWTHGQAALHQMNASESDAQLYAQLAGAIIYPNTMQRGDKLVLAKNRRGQSGLWGYAISGDLPLVLLKIRDIAHIDLARMLVQAHAYWRMKGLSVDLVIWNEDQASYRQVLHEQILGLITTVNEAQSIDRPGGIFVRALDQISAEDRVLIESVARVVIDDSKGTLEEQIKRTSRDRRGLPFVPTRNIDAYAEPSPRRSSLPSNLLFSNGTGGFTPDGKEYVIETTADRRTPLPWSNVLANPYFGTVISESGQSYTWGENAHSFRLTPWHNDPVSDSSGEVFYIRDEETGVFWSPTALPITDGGSYITRHGFGYSTFAHEANGISSALQVYVATDAPVKFSVLKITNNSSVRRSLSVTGYVEWVLGDLRAKSGPHIITEIESLSGALIARNYYNTEFTGRIAFFDCDEKVRTYTGDRREFLGRNGNLENPDALKRQKLQGRTGAGLDACGAIQVNIELAPGEEYEIIFRLGVTRPGHGDDINGFIRKWRGAETARTTLQAVHDYWQETLGAVKVETPDTAVNLLANGWLLYQTIACRLWARSGYYQSGGAFGFRDQLQDTMALVHTKPEFLRAQILLCAQHQFVEGDVQHWWHPPFDRGVRTKCSDDYLWLPLAVCRYIETTGDESILEEVTNFIEGRQLAQEEDSYYDLPIHSAESADIYQHCVRAILHGLRYGEHGLPLIGSCDWNDGMDKVGAHGKGESVWLAFFLYNILMRFCKIATKRADTVFATRCHTEATQLRANIEAHAWDGSWYRRAYFDDGTPLGSASNTDCQIDSLSQSWAALSGAAAPDRVTQAMNAAEARLVRHSDGLVQLLDPPFDKSDLNPGYIRGYVPGVRENGGQYTHAAIWMGMAFAHTGDGQRAWDILQTINPINHGRTAEEVKLYKAEPYVVAADVYGVAPHTGRGGWTWYTGSSGWMYQMILESTLGLRSNGNKLTFSPCLPPAWKSFKASYRFGKTIYKIEVTSGADVCSLRLDGALQEGYSLTLQNDGLPHHVHLDI